ncbi:hypothetical protein VCR29J2_80020 [Vibrio coralliirubri]|nr:hypothetical protein VCR29J2_80020 [Vibrio coralliirubri]
MTVFRVRIYLVLDESVKAQCEHSDFENDELLIDKTNKNPLLTRLTTLF